VTRPHNRRVRKTHLEMWCDMEALVQRVRGEFREMPGLRLTFAQACRLWQLDPTTCEVVLERLTRDGELLQTRQGHYVAAPRPRPLGAPIDRPKRAVSSVG